MKFTQEEIAQSERCKDCGRHYLQMGFWYAADDLWLKIMGSSQKTLCPNCFGERAMGQGIILRWEPSIDWP